MIAIFFMVDRYLKFFAVNNQDKPVMDLIGHFLSFSFTPNYFIAFSLPLGGAILETIIFVVILSLASLIFYLILSKKAQMGYIILLTIILFGAISNMIDRLAYGYVVDYLFVQYFTIFNLADVAISFGAIMIIIKNLKK